MDEKNAGRRPMRARTAIVALLAATIALPLTGCFGLPEPDEFAGQVQELADTLSNVDWARSPASS